MSSNGALKLKSDASWRTDSKELSRLVREGMQEAITAAIAEHHRAGDPVAIWRDGGIVWLYPDGSTRPHIPGEEPPDAPLAPR